jgi:hypothetical protein
MPTPMITVLIRNKDSKKSALQVKTTDNYASDPVESDPVTLEYDASYDLPLTVDNGSASLDWTATATDGRQSEVTTVSNLANKHEVPVSAD